MTSRGWAAPQAKDGLALARGYVRMYAPYLSPTMYAFIPTPVEGLTELAGGPIAVTERLVLLYDPAWTKVAPIGHLAFALGHEVYHDQLRHVRRGFAYPNKERWNQAGDLFINGLMAKQRRRSKTGEVPVWELPDWVLLPSKYGFPDGLTADEYYRLLENKGPKEGEETKILCGGCGGVAGNPINSELEQMYNQQKGRSEAECKAIARGTSKAIESYMKGEGRGFSPGNWSELFEMSEDTYVVPWQRTLSNTLRMNFNNARMGGFDYSMRRPSPRSYLRGIQLPSLISYDPEVMFIVDSSGSMGKPQIGDALRVIADVMGQCGIQSAWFMEADAAAQRTPIRVTPRMLREMKLLGRGGTDFGPALEYAQTFKPTPSVVLYITDGDGSAPAKAPKEFHTVWCVVPSQWGRRPATWGTLVVLDDTLSLRDVV